MYSDDDLNAAVKAHILTEQHVHTFREFIAQQRQSPAVDEENFRLVSSFNDIFVVIASILLLVAVGALGGAITPALAGLAIATTAWGLAEFFTRKRHMALPSIVLLFAYAGGIAFFTGILLIGGAAHTPSKPHMIMLTALLTALATAVHWWRFHVPITVAVGVAATVVIGLSPVMMGSHNPESALLPYVFVAGVAVFAFAMHWDMRDPKRQSSQTDVAFWLHLLAAPLLVHPVFVTVGSGANLSIAAALMIMLMYIVLAGVSLVIDRRALMVSALFYVIYALNTLMKSFGDIGLHFAITALFIGAMLLLLSAFWHRCRGYMMHIVPHTWRVRLPADQSKIA